MVYIWWCAENTYRVNEDERDTRKVANQSDKLVQMVRSTPGNARAHHDDEEAENVLLPLDVRVVLAAAGKQLRLDDTDGGEDLQWSGQQDGARVEQLDRVDEAVLLGQVEEDDRLRLGAVGGVGDGAHGDEEDADDDHDEEEDAGELLRVLHRLLDGDDETNALKGEDGGADEEGPALVVEHDDVGDAVGRQRDDVVVEQVGEADEDEGVGDEGREAELANVAQQGKGEEDDHLHENQVRDADGRFAVGDGLDKGLQVLRGEDDVGGDEANLAQHNRGENDGAHPFTVEDAAHVTKGALNLQTGGDEEHEAVVAQARDPKQHEVTKQHAAAEVRAREEQDAGADKGLEEEQGGVHGAVLAAAAAHLALALALGRGQQRAVLHGLVVVVFVIVVVARGKVLVGAERLVVFLELFTGKVAVDGQKLEKVGRKHAGLVEGRATGGGDALLDLVGRLAGRALYVAAQVIAAEASRNFDRVDVEDLCFGLGP